MTRPLTALAIAVAVVLFAGLATAVDIRHHNQRRVVINAVIDAEERFDVRARGLSFRRRVPVKLAGSAEFRRLLHHQSKSDEKDLEGTTSTFVALGLVPVGTNLKKAVGSLLDAGVVGFYDTDTKRLYVRGGQPTPLARITLAHELTHALQDQHFHLSRFDKLRDEESAAATALIEGDAVRIEREYAKTLSPTELIAAQVEGSRLGGPSGNVPQVLEDLITFPYIAGPTFVDALFARGGNKEVDVAFRHVPPRSTEQILHPDKYFDGDDPDDVKAPSAPKGGKVVDHGQLGEYGLQLILRDAMDNGTADTAAAGWGGDHYVTWRSGGRDHLAARIAMDTERDAIELQDAFNRWTVRHHGAHVTRDHATVDIVVDGPRS